jgi:tryptophan 2,3-dioxygenase
LQSRQYRCLDFGLDKTSAAMTRPHAHRLELLAHGEDAFAAVERVRDFKRGNGGTSRVGYLRKVLGVVPLCGIWTLRTDPVAGAQSILSRD